MTFCMTTCGSMGGSIEVCKERCACASQCGKDHNIFEQEYWKCLGKCLIPQLPLRGMYQFIIWKESCVFYSFFLLMEIFISSCSDFQQRLVRPPYKFAVLGTTCEDNKGYSGISSKSECQAAVKTQPEDKSNLFIDDMSGKGHDLPKGCIADALSLNKISIRDPVSTSIK